MRSLIAAGLWVVGMAACGGGGESPDASVPLDDGATVQCVAGLASLSLAPANSMVTLNGGAPAPITFTATGTFLDSHTAVISGTSLRWSVSRVDASPPGTIANGVLMPANVGGVVTVTATDTCVTGTTTVTFKLDVVIGPPPANPGDWGGTPVTAGTPCAATPGTCPASARPAMVYPADQTRFPRNIYRTLFQWRTGKTTTNVALSEFRVTFAGPGSTVTVYTDGVHNTPSGNCSGKTPPAGCFEADETAWAYIAGSNAGQTVTVTVDGLDRTTTPDPTVRRAAPITIGFSRMDVTGAIFYWSTTSAGVRRANIRAAAPEDYVAKNTVLQNAGNDVVKCVACHVVSRDGKYIAGASQTGKINNIAVYNVTASPPPTLAAPAFPYAGIAGTNGHVFATFSPPPGDTWLVAADPNGALWQIDRATNANLGQLPQGTPTIPGTQPDWSPDFTQLAFSQGTKDGSSPSAIYRIRYDKLSGTWMGPPDAVVPVGAGANDKANLFPQFSPDGQWLAFARGKSAGHGEATLHLHLVAAAPGNTITFLTNANCVVSMESPNRCDTENTMPTWAPPGDLWWIAFNTQREYGVVQASGTQQIWVTAIDPAKLGVAATDPSYPAFRLPFQGLLEDNHRAYWTLDIRDPVPTPDAGLCPVPVPAGAVCDQANDCCEAGTFCDLSTGGVYRCITPSPP